MINNSHLPKEILNTSRISERTMKVKREGTDLFDCRNSIHLANLASDTFYFDSNMSAFFNHLRTIVGELRRCGIAIKFYVGRYHLFV